MAIQELEVLRRRLDLQGDGRGAESDARLPFSLALSFLKLLAAAC